MGTVAREGRYRLEPSQHTGWEERRPNARGAWEEHERSGLGRGGAASTKNEGTGAEQDEPSAE